MTSRRCMVISLGAAVMLPRTALAQPAKVFRVGWLSADQTLGSPFYDAFRGRLTELGYVEGRNLTIDARWGNSPERVPELARDLILSKPDVIVTQGGSTLTLMRAGADGPVVFGYSGNPVEAGLAASFSHPGRNFTGMSFLSLELVGKRLEMLRETIPTLRRVAVFANPQHPGERDELRASEAAAKRVGLSLDYVEFKSLASLDDALGAVVKARCEAMDVYPDVLTMRVRSRIAEFSVKQRIPAISGWARFADSGNLMSYGPNLHVVYRQLAGYVDRIFRGAKPAELPIEFPTAVELVVNLKTANALGLKVPQSVLLRADRVIE